MEPKFGVIDPETGEIVDGIYEGDRLIRGNQQDAIKKAYKRREDMTKIEAYNNSLGGFIFAIYEYSKEINKHEEILTQSDLARLVLLATYINYDGILVYDNGNTITKKNVNTILKLSRNKFKEFYDKLICTNIFVEVDGAMQIDKKYFYKGKTKGLKVVLKGDTTYTRVYIDTFRELYNGCTTTQHKVLGLVYRVIPYINYEWNIISHNPSEKDLEKVKSMKLGELATVLGYNNTTQLKKGLSQFKVRGQKVFGFFNVENDARTEQILVNPYIIYQGNNFENLKFLEKLFGESGK